MILRTLFVRPLRHRPWRGVITVLGVAAGVASVVSTVASSRAAIAAFTEGVVEVAGATRLEVTRAGGFREEVLGVLRPVTGDAVVVPVVEESVLLVELGDGVRLLGVDLLQDAVKGELWIDEPALSYRSGGKVAVRARSVQVDQTGIQSRSHLLVPEQPVRFLVIDRLHDVQLSRTRIAQQLAQRANYLRVGQVTLDGGYP